MTAQSGTAGIDLVRREKPDAVLLDVRLPDRSGLDVLQELRQIDPKLPVIVMTTHGTAETAIEAMQRGAFDYVLKPWDLEELTDLVDKALATGRMSHVPAKSSRRPTATTGSTASSDARRRCRACSRKSAASPART